MGKKKTQPAPVTPPPPEPVAANTEGGGGGDDYSSIMSGYKNFADTGGFSPDDLANIRARSVSPIRAVYANAQREVNRNRALQGGYSPNFNATMAKMAREQSYTQADAATNREAELAEQIREGKLAGLGGMLNASRMGGSGGGGGGGEEEAAPEPEKPKGFWSKFGGALKKIGQVALPIALSPIPGGSIAGKIMGGGLGKVGSSALGGMAKVPNVKPARR